MFFDVFGSGLFKFDGRHWPTEFKLETSSVLHFLKAVVLKRQKLV